MATEFTNYNGQQVANSDWDRARMQASADMYNKKTGKSLTAQQYDQMVNPTTYGARWGVMDPSSKAKPGGLLYSDVAKMPEAATYNATEQTVSDKSTVQNQLANITGNGSALNTMAATEANKSMAARGLLNSSIAVGAAQDAVLKNALPIAQQDAGTYANADAANAQFKNSADQFNAGSKNTMTGQLISADTSLKTTSMNNATQQQIADKDVQARFQLADKDTQTRLQLADKDSQTRLQIADKDSLVRQQIADKDNQTKLQLQNLDAEARKALAVLDEGTKVKLQNLDAADKQLLQTNISAANAYAQLAQALANISTSTTMDAAGKQQATDNQIALFRQNLQALGQVSNLDLSKYFQQVSTSAQTGTDATKAQRDTDRMR